METTTNNPIEIFVSGHMSAHDSASKAKLRKKHSGHSRAGEVVITPAIPYEERVRSRRRDGKLRVAAYCRVSTPSESQVSSIENQKEHFIEYVSRHEDWTLVGIFADEGISGTYLKKRKSFNEMIRRCYDGKIDLILIKDVARYTRNIVDGLTIARNLRALNPPVGIYFETLNMDTLRPDYETMLSVMTTCCQMESIQKSESMKWSIRHRFSNSNFLCPTFYLLGYETSEDGDMVVEEEGAKTVRVIFFMYAIGYAKEVIAQTMTEAQRRTGWFGRDRDGNRIYNTHWSVGAVLSILKNERYVGDVRAQKTYTPDPLTHLSRTNRGEMPSYYMKDHHAGIVSRKLYEIVQKILKSERYRRPGDEIMPSLSVIPKGLLRGFVLLNPSWSGSDLDEYVAASDSAGWEEKKERCIELPPYYRFEMMRGEYVGGGGPSLVFRDGKIFLSMECRRLMEGTEHVEFLLHPGEHLLAVRAADASNPNAVRWANWQGGACRRTKFRAGAVSALVYELMNWNADWMFRCGGQFRAKNGQKILIFDLADTVAYVPVYACGEGDRGKRIGWNDPVFPYEWSGQVVGDMAAKALTKCRMHLCDFFGEWDVDAEGVEAGEYSKEPPVTQAQIAAALRELMPQTRIECKTAQDE